MGWDGFEGSGLRLSLPGGQVHLNLLVKSSHTPPF